MTNTMNSIAHELKSMLSNHADRHKYHMVLQFVDAKENVMNESSFDIYTNDPVKKIWEKVVKLRDKGGYRKLKVVSIQKKQNDMVQVLLNCC